MVPHCVHSDSVHHDYTRITLKASVVLLCIARLDYFSGLGGSRFCTRLCCIVSRASVFTPFGLRIAVRWQSPSQMVFSTLIVGKPVYAHTSQIGARI